MAPTPKFFVSKIAYTNLEYSFLVPEIYYKDGYTRIRIKVRTNI
jgi:hypothetical protein